MPNSRATCVIGRDSVSRVASRRNSSLYAFCPRFVMPHLLPRISIEALEVSTKSGELHISVPSSHEWGTTRLAGKLVDTATDGAVDTYQYDAASHLAQHNTRDSMSVSYQYDAAGELTLRVLS